MNGFEPNYGQLINLLLSRSQTLTQLQKDYTMRDV
ncbi:hypothetical protein ABIB44_000437 [Hymenobacter sp. UYCo722]